MEVDDLFRNRKTQPRPSTRGMVYPVERLRDVWQMFGRNSYPVITYTQHCILTGFDSLDPKFDRHTSPPRGVIDCVGQEIDNHLQKTIGIDQYKNRFSGHISAE